ncbi:flagella synthesis protein FlgN [Chitinolyticbacter meiyuanensis]|uniref:flagella synthesis protein FlgN n=1 Tax=Chitinolyticbacter meiyuanensis TaxID=682798 RepID=UPI0011E59454|nr:flagellar protein FlgN [Chitinolyticbacter meiyuanensis]
MIDAAVPGRPQLAALLEDLEQALDRFNALLEQEEQVLTHARIDTLAQIAQDKLTASSQLEARFQAFRAFADYAGMPLTPAHLLDEALAGFDADIAAQWQRIRRLSQAARVRNASNGRLIETRRNLNDRLIAELSQTRETPQLYGEDGRIRPLGGGSAFDKA